MRFDSFMFFLSFLLFTLFLYNSFETVLVDVNPQFVFYEGVLALGFGFAGAFFRRGQ